MNDQQIQPACVRSLLVALSVSAGLAMFTIHINSDWSAANDVVAESISEEVGPQAPGALPSERLHRYQERQRSLRSPHGMTVIVPAVYVEIVLPADEPGRLKVVI